MKKPFARYLSLPPASDVYSLIQSLNKAERAAVRKIGMKASKKQPLHTHFFELIADGRATDDSSAQAALGLTGGAYFSNLKQHLMTEILDALVHHLHDSSPEAQLSYGIMQLQLLTGRCHAAIAKRSCKKLFAIAGEAGLYTYALEVLYYWQRLIEQGAARQHIAEADEIAGLIERYTACQHARQQVQKLIGRLKTLRASDQLLLSAEQQEQTRHIVDELTSLTDLTHEQPHLKLYHLSAMVMASHMLREYDACNGYCRYALTLLEEQPSLMKTESESFLIISNIAFYNEFARGCIDCVADWLKRFEAIGENVTGNDYFIKRWAIIRFNTTLKIAHKTADFERVAWLIDNESKTILDYTALVMPAAEGLSIACSVLISCFVLERFDAAESLMLEIKEHNRNIERQDIFYFTLIFHLLILYELKDWYRLDAATVAAYHILYNRRKLRPFERELMSFLKALPAKRGRGASEYIRSFVSRLETYHNNPTQRLYFLYFNYYHWLRSKLAGISYMEYKRQLSADALQPT
jgi:hypothetical protein